MGGEEPQALLNSRMIAYPFRLLQCCLVTDGGGALILVAAERARDFPRKPVYLLGTGESVETPMVSQMEDFTSSRAFRVAGPTAFAEAGITHNDVDHLIIYDAFAYLPIYAAEDLVPGTAGLPAQHHWRDLSYIPPRKPRQWGLHRDRRCQPKSPYNPKRRLKAAF
jgi:hypothetical protein